MSFLKNKKILIILLVAVLFIVSSVYGIAKVKDKIAEQQKRIFALEEKNTIEQEEKMRTEEQNKQQSEQQRIDDEQRASEQYIQNKKEDCEAKIEETQGWITAAYKRLGEEQAKLKLAEADKCVDCYSQCLKNNDCSKTSCDDSLKKQCKKNHEENIGFRKKDVAVYLESIKKYEPELQKIKNECSQYIN